MPRRRRGKCRTAAGIEPGKAPRSGPSWQELPGKHEAGALPRRRRGLGSRPRRGLVSSPSLAQTSRAPEPPPLWLPAPFARRWGGSGCVCSGPPPRLAPSSRQRSARPLPSCTAHRGRSPPEPTQSAAPRPAASRARSPYLPGRSAPGQTEQEEQERRRLPHPAQPLRCRAASAARRLRLARRGWEAGALACGRPLAPEEPLKPRRPFRASGHCRTNEMGARGGVF